MLTTISDEMSVNRLVRPRNQTLRLIVNVLSPEDHRRRGFRRQTIGYMQTKGRIPRRSTAFRVSGSGFCVRVRVRGSAVIQVRRSGCNREPNAGTMNRSWNDEACTDPEHEPRSQNAEPGTSRLFIMAVAGLVSRN